MTRQFAHMLSALAWVTARPFSATLHGCLAPCTYPGVISHQIALCELAAAERL